MSNEEKTRILSIFKMKSRYSLELNLYSSLIIAGIIQGFFLSAFILTYSKHRTRASVYLGLLILCITLSNLLELLWEISFLSNNEYNLAYFPFAFLEAPFMYFFGMTFLYPKRKNTWVEKLLYLPFVLILVISIPVKLSYIPSLTELNFFNQFRSAASLVDIYGDFLNIIMATGILFLLLREIKIYEKKFMKFDVSKIKIQLRWLKILIGLLLCFMILWIYASIQYAEDTETPSDMLLVAISIFIYIFGYIGVRKIEVHEERKKIRQFIHIKQDYSVSEETKNKHVLAFEKMLIEEKMYLDPSCNLDTLANELNLSRSHLSRIINSELKTTFSDYLNVLRVNEAKKYLLMPEFSNYTLVAIGLEAGFNSKTTFNSAFKKFAGITPSSFKKLHNN